MICPYCLGSAVLTDSKEVYKRSYGPIWLCRSCQAWVGCHNGTENPLGRLADAELRRYKVLAHKAFDPIWMADAVVNKHRRGAARRATYKWLADAMGISKKRAHIGMFDVEQCKQVIKLCKEKHEACNSQLSILE